jgi:thiamine biosynthesis lipoprotein
LIPGASPEPSDAGADQRRFAARAMASPLRLTIAGDVPDPIAEAAWATVVDEFEASEQAMSRFRDSSGLTTLNQAAVEGRAIAIEGRLRRAIVAADRAFRLTGGRFDPRVLRDLDRLGYRGAALSPTTASGSAADGAPVADRIVSCESGGRVRLAVPIDLGGIGKGLALRWAADRVRRLLRPDDGALIEAGGDIVGLGRGPLDGRWPIGIEDPGGGDDLAVVALDEGALATSSIRVHRWQDPDGSPVHHLLDPGTGRPGGAGLHSVTVAAQDPAWAEVRTKQLFLAGPSGIGALARGLGLAAWWVLETGTLEMTPAARVRTIWVAAEAPSG